MPDWRSPPATSRSRGPPSPATRRTSSPTASVSAASSACATASTSGSPMKSAPARSAPHERRLGLLAQLPARGRGDGDAPPPAAAAEDDPVSATALPGAAAVHDAHRAGLDVEPTVVEPGCVEARLELRDEFAHASGGMLRAGTVVAFAE